MKKIIISLVTAVFCLALITPSAFAGARQRNIWEGVAIGAGAVLLGHALLHNGYRNDPPPRRVTVVERGDRYYSHPGRHDRGYWTVRRVWVPPVCEKVWRPAHVNRHGKRIGGRWIRVEKRSGYWSRQQVWVGCR